ncbi:MAG: sodium-dependent transporter [Oscillospiraceae bacterium]|nr:sodium-dependent transporter [Oscillospiraceae bacterium]MCR5306890.1 sodium-dependent transporter [Oscillospiraceae bacterium]
MASQTQAAKSAGFGSKLGFVLAAAGSAVGLGNIWRFPYLAAKYGGGIFLLIYLILAVTFGFSLMLTEIAIGRRTGKSVIGAYSAISRRFSPLCWLAALVPVIITPYYCVIGGWVLKYLFTYAAGQGSTAAGDGAFFTGFIGGTAQPAVFFLVFMLCTAAVVMLGVEKGIERISKFMMPVLVLLTVGIAVYTLTLDGASAGVKYYLLPNFDGFTATKLLKTAAAAMGQLFYSMSLAMGIMVTYGSYMRKDDSLEQSVRQIEIFDTGIAVLAGLIIVPAVFVFSGGDAAALNAGPGLMFITLPNVFEAMAGGRIIGTAFFLLVALAAMTSSISLMETVVSIIMEKFRMKRIPACLVTLLICVLLGMLSVLGYGAWSEVRIIGKQFLDFFDFISNNIMMPVVALLTCVLIGWIAKPRYVEEEVLVSQKSFRARGLLSVMLRFVCPVCMVIILLTPFVTDI